MGYEKKRCAVFISDRAGLNGNNLYYVGLLNGGYASLEMFYDKDNAQRHCDRLNREIEEEYRNHYNSEKVRAAIVAVNEAICNMTDEELEYQISECSDSELSDIIDIALCLQEGEDD